MNTVLRKETTSAVHHWLSLPVGRICAQCGLVQSTGEFDDSLPCSQRGFGAARAGGSGEQINGRVAA
jgi:hypothetical protein